MQLLLRRIIFPYFMLICCICHSETVFVEGQITYSSLVNGVLQLKGDREFSVQMDDCQWQITTREKIPRVNLPTQYQTTCDSSNVYVVISFNTNIQQSVEVQSILRGKISTNIVTGAAAKSLNEAAAVVFSDIFPDPVKGDHYAIPLWLAFASTCYLNIQTNEMLPPPFPLAPGLDHRTSKMKLKASWQRFNSPPYLPKSIVYYNDGYFYLPSNGKFEKKQYPPPYNEGFTNATFKVIQTTNINGIKLPMAVEFTHFAPLTGGTNNGQTIVIGKYEAMVTKIVANTEMKTTAINAALPLKSLIRDERIKTNVDMADGAIYFSKDGKWLTRREIIERSSKKLDGSKMWLKKLVVIFLMLTTTIFFVFLLRRRGS